MQNEAWTADLTIRYGDEDIIDAVRSSLMLVFELVRGHDAAFMAYGHGDASVPPSQLRFQRNLDITELRRLARGVATQLARLHRAGVCHRDIYPRNVWLLPDRGAAARFCGGMHSCDAVLFVCS